MELTIAGLTKERETALLRVVEEGMCRATAGISEMIGRELTILLPPVIQLVPINRLPHILGRPDLEVVGLYLSIFGDVVGHMTILFSQEQALQLAGMLLGAPDGTTHELGEMEISALSEMGNITGSFFLNALADATDLDIQPSPPTLITDMAGAILDISVVDVSREANETVLFETEFYMDGRRASGYFLIIPNPSALERILQRVC
jgi:chemotaxis protein CheC